MSGDTLSTTRDRTRAWLAVALGLILIGFPIYWPWFEQDPSTPRWIAWLLLVFATLGTVGALRRLYGVYRRPQP